MQSQVSTILDLWAYQNSHTRKADVHAWALWYICNVINQEANTIKRKGVLLLRPHTMTDSFLMSFNLSSIHRHLCSLCPSTTQIMQCLTTTTQQRDEIKRQGAMTQEYKRAQQRETKELTVSGCLLTSGDYSASLTVRQQIDAAMTVLLGERSQRNSLVKNITGLYLCAMGRQRQAISIMSSFGISASYPSIISKSEKISIWCTDIAPTTHKHAGMLTHLIWVMGAHLCAILAIPCDI